MADMIEIAGLWKKQGRSGKNYYSGMPKPAGVKEMYAVQGEGYLTMFYDKDANEENRKPMFKLYFSPKEDSRAQPQKPEVDEEVPW